MSAPKRTLVVAPRARNDLRDALLVTRQRWGHAQADACRQTLFRGLDDLVEHPAIGRTRPELGPETRSHRAGHHVVIYRATDTELRVVRLLHARRDIDNALDEQDR